MGSAFPGLKILLSAGEPSGDAIGAELAKAFARRIPSVTMAGCAGSRMVSEGVRSISASSEFSHAGWSSVMARLPWLVWRALEYYRTAVRFAPDIVVAIDAPGLNRPLLARFQARGVRVVWVAPPQLWAWKSRSSTILKGMSVYPAHAFESESLAHVGAVPKWWGYPGSRPQVERRAIPDCLALFPGSRSSWRSRHTELFARAARQARLPLESVFVHPDPTSPMEAGLRCLLPSQALPGTALALSLPGTATMETAMWGVPTVVAARPGRLDEFLARRHLSEGFRALPNRIAQAPIFPEFYARDASVDVLAAALRELFERRTEVELGLADFETLLGSKNAADLIAADILET